VNNLRSSPLHGGDIADAAALVAASSITDAAWLDLSTGIAPRAYPVAELSQEIWTRLPGRAASDSLLCAAAGYYGALEVSHIVAGPGSQALIERLPSLFLRSCVAIVSPTYGGHAPAWERAGYAVRNISSLDEAAADEIVILVNPNNPDGGVIPREVISSHAKTTTQAGGWLIIDEAFGDVAEEGSSADLCAGLNVISLRSFGKFFGLAGLRLGFAIAPGDTARALCETLGPWPVSGPAIAIGTQALNDGTWQQEQRDILAVHARRLDVLLKEYGVPVSGGTLLFRFCETPHATGLFRHLLTRHIYVRRFDAHQNQLRFGLPGNDEEFERLSTALRDFKA